jgi:hypothetical protein
MKKLLPIAVALAVLSGVFPSVVSAQASNEDTCVLAINKALSREQRTFRAVLFGEPSVKDSPVGLVKYDGEGKPWIRIRPAPKEGDSQSQEEDTWASVSGEGDDEKDISEAAEDFGLSQDAAASAPEGTMRADEDRKIWIKIGGSWKEAVGFKEDDEISGDIPEGTGIFGTRRMMTSELVPYITQGVRTLQCKTSVLCAQVKNSFNGAGGQAGPPGCTPEVRPAIPECDFSTTDGGLTESSRLLDYCELVSQEMLKHEADLLKLAVEYDAAYRSILQFAGNFDLALREFRWPLTFTFRQTAGIIAELGRIPCFLGSCDAYPDTPEFR